MTSARRQATTHQVAGLTQIDGLAIPPELLDLDARVWHDRVRAGAYFKKHDYSLPVRDRMGVGASPASRRDRASEQWASANGVALTKYGRPDLNRLRQLGLIT